jgi:hypothetical protein
VLRYVGVRSVVFEGVSDELVSGRVGSLIHTHVSMRLPCATLVWERVVRASLFEYAIVGGIAGRSTRMMKSCIQRWHDSSAVDELMS